MVQGGLMLKYPVFITSGMRRRFWGMKKRGLAPPLFLNSIHCVPVIDQLVKITIFIYHFTS